MTLTLTMINGHKKVVQFLDYALARKSPLVQAAIVIILTVNRTVAQGTLRAYVKEKQFFHARIVFCELLSKISTIVRHIIIMTM